MQVTYFGHSCFLVNTKGKNLLFDPFITHNDMAKHININEINADYIIQSHGHVDHIANSLEIANNTNAKIICSWEISEWFNKQGYTNSHPMNIGGKWQFDFGTIKCVVAQHSSSLPDGSYGGQAMGFLIMNDEDSFYYAGDTSLTLDMKLIPNWCKPKLSFLPIGDNFTMDASDAILATQFVECNNVMAMHFDTFGYIKIDAKKVKDSFIEAGLNITIPSIGDTYTF